MRKFIEIDTDKLIELYEEGNSIKQISFKLGCSTTKISTEIKKLIDKNLVTKHTFKINKTPWKNQIIY